jgi:hypothetical protein
MIVPFTDRVKKAWISGLGSSGGEPIGLAGAKTAAGGKTGTRKSKGRRFGLYSIGADNPKWKYRAILHWGLTRMRFKSNLAVDKIS